MPATTQAALAEDDFRPVFGHGFPSVDELRRIIDAGLQTLGAMPWRLNDDTLVPEAGSCLACEKRSGRQRLLFPEVESARNHRSATHERCLDPQCFARKQLAYLRQREAALRAKHPDLQLVQVGVGRVNLAVAEAFGEQIARVYAPKYVKAGAAGAKPAMLVGGPRTGKLVHLDLGNATGSGYGNRARRKPARQTPLTLSERRARHHQRRQAFAVKEVVSQLAKLTVDDLAAIVAAPKKGGNRTPFDPLALVLAFGMPQRADSLALGDAWAEYERLAREPATSRLAAILSQLLVIFRRRLTIQTPDWLPRQADEARRVCALLGIDYAQIEAAAVAALPEPASWAKLADDEAPRREQAHVKAPADDTPREQAA